MSEELDLWRLAAGLGLFLFGMHQLERALTQLAGRPFKKFLRQYTAKPLRGVLAGAITTAALQSSSVVSLIVLAFVGTGIISLASALGIVFGSNLGTTMTGWIVATIGFKLDIEALALPLVTLGGFGVVWSAAGTRRAGASHFIVGLGLMLMGLEFMKSGALVATAMFDPSALAGYPLIIFLLAGLLLTAIIQSSSATIMITLSALYAGAIPLEAAAAIAIGADLGTTVTALLGALAGSAAKKRVAAAVVLFNVVADTIAFLSLVPLLNLITKTAGISDPLFALVAFHSLFNLIGIVIFLPTIPLLSKWLDGRFRDDETPLLRHIKATDTAVAEAALENITRETLRLIDQAAALNQVTLDLPPDHTFYDSKDDRKGVCIFSPEIDYERCYAEIKQLEGEILRHALALQGRPLEADEAERLSQIIPSIRNAVQAAKSMKDIYADLELFRGSVNDRFNAYFGQFREAAREFYEALDSLRNSDVPAMRFESLVDIKKKSEDLHNRMRHRIYNEVSRGELSEVEISTLLNVNRELLVANQSLASALADALLNMESSRDFASLPTAR
ncbi:MAG: Na/Pi symporter [Gammaproteobacteria bacterium]|nr:Na/Pi symporter [Gammaproteobacteria bacterium]MBT8110361.1 Na/Pi symporter [Gammaproteobacteria bacterium]NNC58117.1 Na/Pi cotransporter family protein [Woeseiaceae bacterium]NNL45064.1 Na/Pi cotransporter family protein [Woeseiaceae bacterium]